MTADILQFAVIILTIWRQPLLDTPEQQNALIALSKVEATIGRTTENPPGPVVSIWLRGPEVDDTLMKCVALFPDLDHLDLAGTPITDEGLKSIGRLTKLTTLRVRGSRITDAGLVSLAGLKKLELLEIAGGDITDAGLAHLAALDQLRDLRIWDVPLSGKGFGRLKNNPKLRALNFVDVPVENESLEILKTMKRLRHVQFVRANVTKEALESLRQALPKCYVASDLDIYESSLSWPAVLMLLAGTVITFVTARYCWTHWKYQDYEPRIAAGWKTKAIIVLGLVVLVTFGLWRFAPLMSPIRHGNSAKFWCSACRVEIDEEEPEMFWGSHLPRDGWFIYCVQGFHQEFVYRVPQETAIADFPRVLAALETAPTGSLSADVENGYKQWRAKDASGTDATLLLTEIHQAMLDRVARTAAQSYQLIASIEPEFDDRWQRMQHYHWNIVFEFLWLGALVLWGLWPWLRNRGTTAWVFHLSTLPLLFFLPYWMGYGVWTFTSKGPSGGALYPWLLIYFDWLPTYKSDAKLIGSLPQWFEPLAQDGGPILSISGGRRAGPIAAMGLALVCGLTIFAVRIGPAQLRRLTHGGQYDSMPSMG